ncbi:Tetracycline repressor protein class D [Delftia tsuruhatensis]|nr:Tetracycline repressor protein class D [Delftia tsuruhatensis]CAC9687099.1 Tetracycline repressor protein class D [Delftia tsuruhatensis]
MQLFHIHPISDRALNDTFSPRLSRDTVLRAALDLLNEVGIDALSTRRLAERLGVQSPTLYWHFKNKAELLAAMNEAILEQHQQSLPNRSLSWQEGFVANAHSFRRALLAYRDGARLHAGTRPHGAQFEALEAKLALMHGAGFEPGQAIGLMLAISRFVVGWVLEEQAAPEGGQLGGDGPDPTRHPLSARGWQTLAAQAPDEVFDRQLRLFVAGAQAMLAKDGA